MRRTRIPGLLSACAVFVAIACGQIRITPVVALGGNPNSATLSPDGKTLAFHWCKPGGACGLYTRPLVGGEPRLLAGKDSKARFPVGSPRWSPDGGRIAFLRDDSDSHLAVRDVASGAEWDFGVVFDSAAWSPDGRFLVAGTYTENPPTTFDSRPTLFSAATGKRIRALAPRGEGAVFSPDGRKLAYYDADKLMLLRLTVDLRPDGEAATLVQGSGKIWGVLWTANGSSLVYESSGVVSKRYRVAPQPGAQPQLITGIPGNLALDQFLADGSVLATENTQVQTFGRVDVQSRNGPIETVDGPGCSLGGPGCSLDGRFRAYVTGFPPTSERAIWVENADGNDSRLLVKSIPPFEDPKGETMADVVSWSPDGKWIVYKVSAAHWTTDARSQLYVVPSSGGTPQRLAAEAFALEHSIWSQDGKSLYAEEIWPANSKKPAMVRIDVANGKLTALGFEGTWPRLSADGRLLYFFTEPSEKLSRMAIDTGAVTRLREQNDLSPENFVIGARFAYAVHRLRGDGRHGYRVIQYDPERGLMELLAGASSNLGPAHLSPDERFLYFEQKRVERRRVVRVRGID